MNRLIILGNGFDLVHNIKTSFSEFTSDYFCQAINSCINKDKYEDNFLLIRFKMSGYTVGKNMERYNTPQI